ncbi:MAG: hypothetical protein IIB28_11835 [Chloroflexi bacterium]|nr:hypothetical protein [Chloroflexota bacterium]
MNPIARYPQYLLFALAVAFVVTGLTTAAVAAAAGGTAIAVRQMWKRRKRDKNGRDL